MYNNLCTGGDDMITTTVPITVPEGLVPYLDPKGEGLSFAQKALLLYPFIRERQISHGRAAEILGVRKLDLIDYYCELGLPYLNQSASEMDEEMADIRRLEEADS